MIVRWIVALIGALINGILWMLLSSLLLSMSWAIALGLLAFVASLPLVAAVVLARGDINSPDRPAEMDPAETATLPHSLRVRQV